MREEEFFDILSACHDSPCGGHFSKKGFPSNRCRHVTIDVPFTRMLEDTLTGVTSAKGWENLNREMICLFTLRWL